MEKEEIKEVLEMVSVAKEFKPVADEAMVALKTYIPHLTEVYEGLLDYGIEKKDYAIKKYISMDYTREEAILLVLDSAASFKTAIKGWNANLHKQGVIK